MKKSLKLKIVRQMILAIGDDPYRLGLLGTPERVVKMWKEVFVGYNKRKKPQLTYFENNQDGVNMDEMIMDSGYFYSYCEHHIIPLFGRYWFGYIPRKKILGLSKVARVVDYFSAKLQIQERLTDEIVS